MSKLGFRPERAKRFQELKTVKLFDGGHQSQKVRLLEGSQVVAKHFDRLNPTHVAAYELELHNLARVRGCSFVPKLLAADPVELVIYTNFCGDRPSKYTKQMKADVKKKLAILRSHFKLGRNFVSRPDGLPKLANLTVLNGNVTLIDMGPPWKTVA